MRLFLVFCLALFVLAGCSESDPVSANDDGNGDNNPTPVQLEPTLSSIQQLIFSPKCATSGCHAGGSPAQGMSLEGGSTRNNTVNVSSIGRSDLLRIAPGDPDASYLVKKVQGDSDISGGRMPLGRTALSADEIDAIRQWILDGAPDN